MATNQQSTSEIETTAASLQSSALVGSLAWLFLLAWLHPSLFETRWAVMVLLLTPLVLVPMALRLILDSPSNDPLPYLLKLIVWLQPPAAWLLLLSFAWPSGTIASLLTLPWLVTTGLIAAFGLLGLFKEGLTPLANLSIRFGLIYLVIGGGWTALSRFGLQPLDFDSIIVLLTAIHFHYAGFVLPIVTGLVTQCLPHFLSRMACIGVILSVPLVAVGITSTQLGVSPLVEALAAWSMALVGLLVAWLHLRLAWQPAWPRVVRLLWAIAAASLFFGMVLAALYGSRAFFEMPWLDIPWMRALHGTANALGFSLIGLLAWLLSRSSSCKRVQLEQRPPVVSE